MLLEGQPNTLPYSIPPIVLPCSSGITQTEVMLSHLSQGLAYKKIIDQPCLTHISSNGNQATCIGPFQRKQRVRVDNNKIIHANSIRSAENPHPTPH
jgi:hypothetical protein